MFKKIFKLFKASNILKESPFDHEVTRKVKRAATEIDKFRFVD